MIESIQIAQSPQVAAHRVDQVRALPGLGLEGDRYAVHAGTFSSWPKDHELTLIEAESIEQANQEHGLSLTAAAMRRNLVTRGIRLNPLVGQKFLVGSVLCEGTRLCEPCGHLENVAGNSQLRSILAGRGGLRARILEEGIIRVGDAITIAAVAVA